MLRVPCLRAPARPRQPQQKAASLYFAGPSLGFQLNMTVTTRSLVSVRLQPRPVVESHPTHPPNVDPELGVAVSVTVLLAGKGPAHSVEHPSWLGKLRIVPKPVPENWTVTIKLPLPPLPPLPPPPAPPVPEAQVTFAVIEPLMIAPEEERPPALLLVLTVAVTKELPQSTPPGERPPVDVTTATAGVLEFQRTWLVMSLVTGG